MVNRFVRRYRAQDNIVYLVYKHDMKGKG